MSPGSIRRPRCLRRGAASLGGGVLGGPGGVGGESGGGPSLPAEGEGDRPPAAAKSSKSDSVQRAEKVGLVAAPPPHARVVSRSEHLHLKARKHKWYDDYEGRDMDLLRRLQSMSRHKVDSVMDPVLAPHPPANV